MSQRPKKGILALSSCHLLHLILAGVGDWNKSSHLRLPPKRESIYLHMSHKPKKEGDPCSVLLPSPSPHFGGSWRLEQKFTSPTPAKKIELSPHVTKTKEGDPCSVLLPSPSPHFGGSWRLEQNFISPTPAKKILLRAFLSTHHKSQGQEGDLVIYSSKIYEP